MFGSYAHIRFRATNTTRAQGLDAIFGFDRLYAALSFAHVTNRLHTVNRIMRYPNIGPAGGGSCPRFGNRISNR